MWDPESRPAAKKINHAFHSIAEIPKKYALTKTAGGLWISYNLLSIICYTYVEVVMFKNLKRIPIPLNILKIYSVTAGLSFLIFVL